MKKLIMFLFSLILSVVFSTSALAYDVKIDGIYYKLYSEAKTARVTSGEEKYTGEVVIPSSITVEGQEYLVKSIGNKAFYDCSGLTSVTIPNSVTSIGSQAFRSCSGLTSVDIPNSVTSIGSCAFLSCSGLTAVTIPNSVTSIGERAFSNCSGLEDIIIVNDMFVHLPETYSGHYSIPENISQIIGGAFLSCSGLTAVTIPNSVTSIGERAFSNCSGLTSVDIPNSVTSIGDYAFGSCSGLTSVTIPNSVTSIGSCAFLFCSGLEDIIIVNDMFVHLPVTYSGHYSIPENISQIIGGAFFDRKGLTSVTIPNSVTSIGQDAFYGCEGLRSVTIPNSVTSIGQDAFSWCKGLTSVTIPNSVTSIGDCAFSCSGLEDIIIVNNMFVYLPETYSGHYSIPENISQIIGGAFYWCSGLTSVTIPNSVTSIGYAAFRDCRGLTSVTIPNSVTSIGVYAFHNCTGLTSVTISNSVTSIESLTFCGCSSLTSVDIPNSVTSIGTQAFSWCSGLKSVTIPNSVTSIGNNAFLDCSGLTSVNIPNSVTSIGDGTFNECTGLTSVTIPNSVTSIGNNAFYGCKGLKSVTIPNSVTSIGDRAFEGCSGLTSVTIPNSVTSIGYCAFASCSKLENFYCYAEKVPSTYATAFENSYIESSTLHVPSSALSLYEATAPWSGFGNIKEIPSTIQAVVGSNGIATYCSPLNLDFTDVNGVNAYIASEYNSVEGTITMTKVNEVPAGTGFILKGSPATYNIPVKSDVKTSFVNLLVGTVVATEVPGTSNGYDNYILGNGYKGVAFYKSIGVGFLAANKAYLRLPSSGSSSAKAVHMSFDDDATTEILLLEGENTEETSKTPVYDLNGMQKSGISKGWNIVNGKKILIKK